MRYISVFSGVEAASVAWEPLGWEPVAFCEVDEFPSAVLAYRFPNVPNLGDITKVDWSEFADGSVDIVIGGSPCQSFSVAGKREGLKGESGLMFEYIRCVREVRPRYFVWENVPGAFSSEKGEAFRQLLSEMDDLGYGLAWRVLDAQFFGVAQRRRRVFLVGSLGDQRAAEILFESDGLRWDHPSSRDKRESLTRAAQQRAEEGCGDGCLKQLYENHGQDSRVKGPCETAPTVSAKYGTGGGNTPLILAFNTTCITSPTNGNKPQWGDPCHCLAAQDHPPTIIIDRAMKREYIVRRLTPRECERLQGFPDGWTLIPYRGKPAESCPDGPRYKAMGNSFAVPVVMWIGERIAEVDAKYNEKEWSGLERI